LTDGNSDREFDMYANRFSKNENLAEASIIKKQKKMENILLIMK